MDTDWLFDGKGAFSDENPGKSSFAAPLFYRQKRISAGHNHAALFPQAPLKQEDLVRIDVLKKYAKSQESPLKQGSWDYPSVFPTGFSTKLWMSLKNNGKTICYKFVAVGKRTCKQGAPT
jgi:hypothetical protein